jgi:hypothetical protein
MVLASDVSVGGVVAVVVLGLVSLTAGGVILRDWRGWGSRSYRFTVRLPLPGAGFYRSSGYNTYRALVGGGYTVLGLAFLIVAAVVAMR